MFLGLQPSQLHSSKRVRRPLGISDSRLASAPVRLSDPGPETQRSPPETDEKKVGNQHLEQSHQTKTKR